MDQINEKVESNIQVSMDNKVQESTTEKIAENVVENTTENTTENTLGNIDDSQGNKKKLIIKIGLVLLLIAIVIIIAILAWFVMTKNSDVEKMNNAAVGLPFEIITDANKGVYGKLYEDLNPDGKLWLVDEESNFSNYNEEETDGDGPELESNGIEPGSAGKLKFKIRATASDSVTLNLFFLLKGVVKDDLGELSELEENSSTEKLRKCINSHILLFENYNSSSGKYSGLIKNGNDLKKVLANKTYSKTNNEYTYIYWIWPKYLKNLTGDNLVYVDSEKEDMIDYIVDNKDGFFSNLSAKLSSKLKENLMSNTNYPSYSEAFDKVDLLIGNNINYVILSLSAFETS